MTLGLRLRKTRLRAGLTLRAMAQALNVSHSTIGHWENDRSAPNVRILVEYYRLTGVDLHWLVYGEKYAPSPRKNCA